MNPRRVNPRDDRGLTLIEMTAAISIFTIFIIIFLTAVSGFVGTIVNARAVSEGAGTNANIVNFVDRQVRYAEAVNFPGEGPTGLRYIEFLLPRNVTDTGAPVCYQWRYNPISGDVAVRSWAVNSSNAAVSISGWMLKGQGVVDGGTVDYPFAMLPANVTDGTLRQRLQITLSTGIGGGETTETVTTFVARNSSNNSVTNTDANADGQSDTRVCMQAGGRV